jgi:hypothetical protein
VGFLASANGIFAVSFSRHFGRDASFRVLGFGLAGLLMATFLLRVAVTPARADCDVPESGDATQKQKTQKTDSLHLY